MLLKSTKLDTFIFQLKLKCNETEGLTKTLCGHYWEHNYHINQKHPYFKTKWQEKHISARNKEQYPMHFIKHQDMTYIEDILYDYM
jgi:hypothetical protein